MEPYGRVAENTEIKVCLLQVDIWHKADTVSGTNQSRAVMGGQKLYGVLYGCHGRKGGVAEEVFTSGVLVFLCVFWSKLRCQIVWSPLLHIKHLVRSTSWEKGYGHTKKSARLLCSSLLVFFSIVQLFARSQWNSILSQWTLTRLDPWIELQTIKEKKRL